MGRGGEDKREEEEKGRKLFSGNIFRSPLIILSCPQRGYLHYKSLLGSTMQSGLMKNRFQSKGLQLSARVFASHAQARTWVQFPACTHMQTYKF